MLLCRVTIPAAHGDASQLETGGVLPGGVPGRFVERIIRRVPSRLHDQRQPEIVIGFAVVRIGVVSCQAGDRGAEEGFRIREATASAAAAGPARCCSARRRDRDASLPGSSPRPHASHGGTAPSGSRPGRATSTESSCSGEPIGRAGVGTSCPRPDSGCQRTSTCPAALWIATSTSRVSIDAIDSRHGDSNEMRGGAIERRLPRGPDRRCVITARQARLRAGGVGSHYSPPFVQLERDGRIERGVLDRRRLPCTA